MQKLSLAVASGIAIDVRSSREGPVHVLADEQRLRQVLLNLITNGVKFNRPHGRVTVTVHVVHDAFVIRVADTGTGIAPAIPMPSHRLRSAIFAFANFSLAEARDRVDPPSSPSTPSPSSSSAIPLM